MIFPAAAAAAAAAVVAGKVAAKVEGNAVVVREVDRRSWFGSITAAWDAAGVAIAVVPIIDDDDDVGIPEESKRTPAPSVKFGV